LAAVVGDGWSSMVTRGGLQGEGEGEGREAIGRRGKRVATLRRAQWSSMASTVGDADEKRAANQGWALNPQRQPRWVVGG
jgi:hypothetical protein